jgi:hypothetical protein
VQASYHDLKGRPFNFIAIGPHPCLEPPLDKNRSSLRNVLASHFGNPLPCNAAEPFNSLFLLSVSVLECFVHSNGEIRNSLATLGISEIGILTDIASDNDFVHTDTHGFLPRNQEIHDPH